MKKTDTIIVLNIMIPIIVGTMIYYVLSPEVIFVKQIDHFIGNGFHISSINTGNILFRFIRNHFLDMLWGYALVFALFFVMGNNTADLNKIFLPAFLFTLAMEFLQLTPIAHGTFDLWDIFVEFVAEAVAVFIIKILQLRRNSK